MDFCVVHLSLSLYFFSPRSRLGSMFLRERAVSTERNPQSLGESPDCYGVSRGEKGSTDMLDFRESSASAKNPACSADRSVRNDWTKRAGKKNIHRRVGNLSCAVTNNVWTYRSGRGRHGNLATDSRDSVTLSACRDPAADNSYMNLNPTLINRLLGKSV